MIDISILFRLLLQYTQYTLIIPWQLSNITYTTFRNVENFKINK